MRSFALVFLILSSATTHLEAASPQKAYFAATHPGTWAKYESKWEMPDGLTGTNIYTYVRAPDSSGRVLIEIDTETLAGPGEGMTTRQLLVMEPGFDMAKNFLNHMMFTEASIAQSGDGPPSVTPDNVIEIMRDAAGDLTNSVTYKGKATREGRTCDAYAYSFKSGGPRVTHQEGEICLDEDLPFGLVHQNGIVKDAEGNLLSSFEQKLLDSGTGESGTATLLAMTPEAQPTAETRATADALPSLSILEAYQSGKIRISVKVNEDTGGRRLTLVALNKIEEPFELVVPEGMLTIPADSPLGALRLYVDNAQRFSLSPGGGTPPIEAGQPGDRGATAGTFQLTVYEGQPLFQGSVEVGPLN